MDQAEQDALITVAHRSLFFKVDEATRLVVAWNATFDITSQGRTREEAEKAIRGAVVMFVRDLARRRIPTKRAAGWMHTDEAWNDKIWQGATRASRTSN